MRERRNKSGRREREREEMGEYRGEREDREERKEGNRRERDGEEIERDIKRKRERIERDDVERSASPLCCNPFSKTLISNA